MSALSAPVALFVVLPGCDDCGAPAGESCLDPFCPGSDLPPLVEWSVPAPVVWSVLKSPCSGPAFPLGCGAGRGVACLPGCLVSGAGDPF